MLGQQFYENPKFQDFLSNNFVAFRADRDEKSGAELFKKFGIGATPTTMIIDSDGTEYDWWIGYDPPPDNFQARIEKALSGVDTYKAISAAYAKNPKDVPTVFKLARKYAERFDEEKAAQHYKEVIALDPQGKAGTYTTEYTKVTVPYTEYAEFALAVDSRNIYGEKPNMEPVRAFFKKYSDSKLTKEAYQRMANYYAYSAPKEEAAKFFAEYTEKFPSDIWALDGWLSRIVRDKEPLDKGLELAAKLEELTRENPIPRINQDIANLYFLKDDKAKAKEVYGKEFMEGRRSMLSYDLISYANFWVEKEANQESAVAMAETALKLDPENAYFTQQVAYVYLKTGKEEKALALFGPEYARKKVGDDRALYSYTNFWSRQGKNLESALEAAKKIVEKKPGTFYYWSVLGDIYLKMKNYPEALKATEKAYELAEEYAKKSLAQKLEKIKVAQAEEKK
ncbi:MAG: tetratricopeptide repeat protein [Acidobacteriota bacterium]